MRIRHGYTARGLSIDMGQSPSYISNIENGVSLPSIDNFLYFCEHLGITPGEFFEEDCKEVSSPKIHELMAHAEKLKDSDLDMIIAFVRRLAKG